MSQTVLAQNNSACDGVNTYPDWPRLNWQQQPNHAASGDLMQHQGKLYKAKWWTKSIPGSSNAWQYIKQCSTDTVKTPVQSHGKLSVCNNKLCNMHNQPIQLRGMSSHGLQWYGLNKCLTEQSFDTLATDWQADIVRLSLYVQEGGYESDPVGFTEQVNTLINMASDRGLYVLVDWHQLTPGDPNENLVLAKRFFNDVVNANKSRDNIIYDIANEPNNVSWMRVKEYAEQVIPVIREIDPDAVILVGTHGWSTFGASDGGSYEEVVQNPIAFNNIMYTFHFYSASHQDFYLQTLDKASDELPVFVSEWGTQTYSGDGENDFVQAQKFVELMERKKISWTNWNYSDDFRSGAVWKTGSCNQQRFSDNELKPAGLWIKQRIKDNR